MAREEIIIRGGDVIALRKKNHWSQRDLADLLNVSTQAVIRWEKDDSKMPKSTMYLVLLALLVAAGIELRPKNKVAKSPLAKIAPKHENAAQRIRRMSRDLDDALHLCQELARAKDAIEVLLAA